METIIRGIMTTIHDAITLDITKVQDTRGNLSVLEGNAVPFEMKRVYYLYDIPSGGRRGGHSHKMQQELLIALSGSFDVILNDGNEQKTVTLNKPNVGLVIPNGIWRELENFSSGSVCLVLASDVFEEADYIRDFADFKLSKNGVS
ncbi:FdtA/QdtA family cupin domain-containing protein [Flavobacterium sp. AS60]|uniref:sugar 3,4-ketoisomerase n=1 Tax=Flavobacterium anseongense TaxID=2910677 RepID=UPI001F29A857|nr:FdtA/QdtA family cupin domain-containing protein [Flavobacterium sp. AS60]MCF6130449.1 FdtA/QdtA family cupin domain-containing protein [Flavobacterium sp. AS60]